MRTSQNKNFTHENLSLQANVKNLALQNIPAIGYEHDID